MSNYRVYVDETTYQVTVDESSQNIVIRSQGTQGPAGEGVPAGGTTGQLLAKASNTSLDTEWIDPSTVGGVLLRTDSVDNGTQSTLDLIGGTNITLTDNGFGAVTIDGSGATIGDAVSGGTNNEVLYVNGSGNLDSDSSFMRLQDDEQSTKMLSKTKASYLYDDGVQIDSFIADNPGTIGNSIALVANGSDDWTTILANWNAANPTNTASLADGNLSDVPNAGTYTLANGSNGVGFFSGAYSNAVPLQGLGLGIEYPISATETAVSGTYNLSTITGYQGVGSLNGTLDFTNNLFSVQIAGDGLIFNVVSDGNDTAYQLMRLSEGNYSIFNSAAIGIGADEVAVWGKSGNNFRLPMTSTPSVGDILAVTNITAGPNHELDFIRNRSNKDSAASANDLDLPYPAKVFEISGTTQINGIKADDFQDGEEAILIFTDALTVKHNGTPSAGYDPILLAGSVDLITSTDTVLHIVYFGNKFREVSRTVP